jgi:membrane protease YdiL (CAAX protease family)
MVLWIIVTVYVAALLAWQWRRGVFSPAAFNDAPPRQGQLELRDLLLTIGLWLLGTGGAQIAAVQVVGRPADPPEPAQMLALQTATYAGWLPALGYIFFRAATAVEGGVGAFGLSLRDAGRTLRTGLGTLVFIIPASFLTLQVCAAAMRWMGFEMPAVAHQGLNDILASPLAIRLAFIVVAAVVAPLVEEIAFRGMLQTAIRQGGLVPGRWSGILIVSVLFTAIHLPALTTVAALPGLFVLAVGLGYAYEKTGSLWPPIVIHAVFNGLNLAAVLFGLVPGETAAAIGG